jgi:hypothetical protein
MLTTFDLIRGLGPKPLRGVPYSDWIHALSTEGSQNPLHPLIPMLIEKVFEGRTRWEMQENMAIFGRANLCSALQDRPDLLECEPMATPFKKYAKSWL